MPETGWEVVSESPADWQVVAEMPTQKAGPSFREALLTPGFRISRPFKETGEAVGKAITAPIGIVSPPTAAGIQQFIAGSAEDIGKIVEATTSPLGYAAAGVASIGPVVARLVAAGFGIDQAIEAAKQSHSLLQERPRPGESVTDFLTRLSLDPRAQGAATQTAFSILAGIGALRGEKPTTKAQPAEPAKAAAPVETPKPSMPPEVAEGFEVISEKPIAPLVEGKPIAGFTGKAATLKTPQGDVPTQYKVVDISELKTSHDPVTFAERPDFPAGVQERTYHLSKEAQGRVIAQAQKYDPAFTINSDPTAVNGPPIITPSGIVLGGNSRTMSTARLYAEGRGEVYRQRLIEKAEDFGVHPDEVQKVANPVLVREVTTPITDIEAARRIASDLNKNFTGALSFSEKAVSAGKSITQETQSQIGQMLDSLGEDATIRDLLRDKPREVVKLLEHDGIISDRERPQYVDAATGALTDQGKDLAEGALLGSVIDDVQLLQSAPRSVLARVERSLSDLARLKARGDEWDITPLLRQAVREQAQARAQGIPTEDYLSQTSMFGPPRSPAVEALTRILDRKPTEVASAFKQFAQDATADVQEQSTLGFYEPPQAFKSFNEAFGANISEQQFTDALKSAVKEEFRGLKNPPRDTGTTPAEEQRADRFAPRPPVGTVARPPELPASQRAAGPSVGELRLRAAVAQQIAKDVPLSVIAEMKPPQVERVMFQIADLIEQNPGAIARVPELLKSYDLRPEQLAAYLRDAATKSGRTLGAFGWIGRELRKNAAFQTAEVQEILGEVREPAPYSWAGLMDRFAKLENIRLAAMVSQWQTAVRNAITQTANYGLMVVEDTVDGLAGWKRGQAREVAFARSAEDVHAILRSLTKEGRSELDSILSQMPIESARLLDSPIADVTLGSRVARFLTTFTRTQEEYFRRLIFDSTIRGQLREQGFNVEGMPSEWDAPMPEIAKAADFAVKRSLERTWAETPDYIRGLLQFYGKHPWMRLIQPFPRFFFGNALKFIYQYSPAGFFTPETWAKLQAGDTALLTRAAIGTTMLGFATAYRAQPDAPGEWYKIRVGNKTVDTRPFAPLISPYLFAGEMILDAGRAARGMPARLESRDLLAFMLGLNRIAGTGLAIFDSVLDKRGNIEAQLRTLKQIAGSYVASFGVPLLMVRDVVAQVSPEDAKYRDIRGNEFLGPIARNLPFAGRLLPESPGVTRPGTQSVEAPLLGQLTGIRTQTPTPVETELSRLGIRFADVMPPSSGKPDVDRRAKEIEGERLEEIVTRIINRESYKQADDAKKKDTLLTVLANIKNAAARRALAEAELRKTTREEKFRGAERTAPRR